MDGRSERITRGPTCSRSACGEARFCLMINIIRHTVLATLSFLSKLWRLWRLDRPVLGCLTVPLWLIQTHHRKTHRTHTTTHLVLAPHVIDVACSLPRCTVCNPYMGRVQRHNTRVGCRARVDLCDQLERVPSIQAAVYAKVGPATCSRKKSVSVQTFSNGKLKRAIACV